MNEELFNIFPWILITVVFFVGYLIFRFLEYLIKKIFKKLKDRKQKKVVENIRENNKVTTKKYKLQTYNDAPQELNYKPRDTIS